MSSASEVAKATGLRTYEDYLSSTRKGGQSLGKTDFLQLLAAQLQYQNPLEPMNDSDFVAQLAQFSSLEQMETLNKTMSNYQYYGLAGKYVSAEIKLADGREGTVVGVVDSVFTKNGTSYAEIGNCIFIDADNNQTFLKDPQIVLSSNINQVYDNSLFTPNGATLLEASTLIGKIVKGSITVETNEPVLDENDEPVLKDGEPVMKSEQQPVTGIVTRVAKTDEGLFAYIEDGGEEIAVLISSIVDIKENKETTGGQTL